jgi:phosphatidylglycerophosphate synthase
MIFSLKPGLYIFWWMTAVIISRDVIVTALRNRSQKLGIKFKTSFVAKAKTATQMIVIALVMIYMILVRYFSANAVPARTHYDAALQAILPGQKWYYLPLILTALATLFTIYTLIDYVASYAKNRRLSNGGAGKE